MEDQGIVKESNSSDPNPRYISDSERFQQVVVTSMQFFLLLMAFLALAILDDGKKFMAEHHAAMTALLLALVLFFQAVLLLITLQHPVNSSFFAILFMLVLSSVVSVIEVSLVSWTAAVITLILWGITITMVVIFNWQEFRKLLMAASAVIKKMAETFVRLLPFFCIGFVVFTTNAIVVYLCSS